MTPQAARVDQEIRARERFRRAKRLEWSIQCREGDKEDLGRLIQLLHEALDKTKSELHLLEVELGYKIKDQEDKES